MNQSRDNNSRLVYSSEKGRVCPKCENPPANCTCARRPGASEGDGIVRVRRETKGRKGKGVTLIAGITGEEGYLKDLARRLKARCGSGGTIKNGVIEIQGDHRDLLIEALEKEGFTVKRAGG